MSIVIQQHQLTDFNYSSKREYLETNKCGVYSSSTISGCNTRKYHGVFVVRQPQINQYSYVLLNALHETVRTEADAFELGTHQFPFTVAPKGFEYLQMFELKKIPTWTFKIGNSVLRKELLLPENSVQVLIKYTLLEGDAIDLDLSPYSSFRRNHDMTHRNDIPNPQLQLVENGISFGLKKGFDTVFIQTSKKSQINTSLNWFHQVEYLEELDRGYEFQEDVLALGKLSVKLSKGEELVFSIATKSVEPEGLVKKFNDQWKWMPELNTLEDYLEKAAEQFITESPKGTEIGAGYHWFGRWGRDTFISLPGLTVERGRPEVCKQVLKTMLKDLKGGLLTNIGVGDEARYNSADASLWFFWALQEYVDHTQTHSTIWKDFGKEIKYILSSYRDGTMYNIHMKENGLLYGGQEDVALTWMDAMVDGYPVTPRAGFTVELNALWYNAIVFSIELANATGDKAFVQEWEQVPASLKKAFKDTFWSEEKGYLADAVDHFVPDFSFRPNQVFATSLKYPICDEAMSKSILKLVKEKLLTPRGLRTLSCDDEKYIGIYHGDQRTRDLSYHQGIVWPWLLGHFASAYVRYYQDSSLDLLNQIYSGFEDSILEYGLGSVAEIYDGDAPFEAKGTISQAWSVAELIRIKNIIYQYNSKK